MKSMRAGSNAAGLRLEGLFVCILQIAAAAVLPALTFIWVFNGQMRWSIVSFVHWGISSLAGVLGIIALATGRKTWLSLHVVLGTIAAAALAAHDTVIFTVLELRCSLQQGAYAGCATCACASTNSCSQADLDSTAGCSTCSAFSTTFCNKIDSNRVIIAITAVVTLLSMAAPVLFSLLVLLQQREAPRETSAARSCESARALLAEQLARLRDGLPLSQPVSALVESIALLRERGTAEDKQVAEEAVEALQQAALSIANKQVAEASAVNTGQESLEQGQAGMLGQSLYSSEPRRPDQVASEDAVHRVNSVRVVSRKSSIVSMASSVLSNPLLRSSNDFSSKIKQQQKPAVPQIIVESSSMLETSASTQSFVLPGESEMIEESNQEGMDLPPQEGGSASKKHHHRKSRKHHHKERPESKEALTAMAGAYGVALEDKPRKDAHRRDYDDLSDASDNV